MKRETSNIKNIEGGIQGRHGRRREKHAPSALKDRRRRAKAARIAAEKARRGFVAARRVVLIGLSIPCICFVVYSVAHIMDLQGQYKAAAAKSAAMTEQKERLESELAALTDKEYIEERAREKLGMIKKDEILYVFESPGESVSADPADSAANPVG
ncbi:MAG: septum formation initiator family protein [Clostridiales Family XIII bacterium]|nr:septum formation initiator family protein [Clostridiales Family XIII bacterium]